MTTTRLNPDLNTQVVQLLTEQSINIDRSITLTWTVYGVLDNGAITKNDLILKIGCHTYHNPTKTIIQETSICKLNQTGDISTHLSTIAKVHGRYYDLRDKHGD